MTDGRPGHGSGPSDRSTSGRSVIFIHIKIDT